MNYQGKHRSMCCGVQFTDCANPCFAPQHLFYDCRIIDDDCLENIAKYCSDLEQLDILGTNRVYQKGLVKYVIIYFNTIKDNICIFIMQSLV